MSGRKLMAIMLLLGSVIGVQGQNSDAFDVKDYDLSLDMSSGNTIVGEAIIRLSLTASTDMIALSLIGEVDSLEVAGAPIQNPNLQQIPTQGLPQGEDFDIAIWYRVRHYVERYGFGGLHMDADMTYNLGVGFDENPHVMGRVLFPCHDNFDDKATYTLRVKSRPGWTAQCGGILQSRHIDSQGCESTVWRIDQEVCTYLVSVSQADYHVIETTVAGNESRYPLTLSYTTQDSTEVRSAFAALESVVPMFERCLGPYRWERIGYIPTTQGSMEHVNNIALAKVFFASTNSRAQATIAHELGHSWFGNLVTCSTEGDMWFNEGGASFCSELAIESVRGKGAANSYYQTNLESVIRTTHLTDGGYFALSGMPHNLTYGSTTYDKGALVWHSLRGYLGDSIFYNAMNQLMTDKAFTTVDAEEVCHLLSQYSGVNLQPFFDFHVLGAGFVDYHIDYVYGTDGNLTISQQGIGTDAAVLHNRVPIRLHTWYGTTHDIVVAFDGRDTTFALADYLFQHHPSISHEDAIAVKFCTLDPTMAISDAATYAEISIDQDGQRGAESSHIQFKTQGLEQPTQFYIEHHWGTPYDLLGQEGIHRVADRYWVIHSSQYINSGVQGRLRYTRGTFPNATYENLDRGWFTSQSTLDSVEVMYRENSRSEWRAISHRRSGDLNEGFFLIDNFRPGEYTFAVVDRTLLGFDSNLQQTHLNLFPNPVEHDGEIEIRGTGTDFFEATIYDLSGRQVWKKQHCSEGERIKPMLERGTYLVIIQNNFISLQSNLIQL